MSVMVERTNLVWFGLVTVHHDRSHTGRMEVCLVDPNSMTSTSTWGLLLIGGICSPSDRVKKFEI